MNQHSTTKVNSTRRPAPANLRQYTVTIYRHGRSPKVKTFNYGKCAMNYFNDKKHMLVWGESISLTMTAIPDNGFVSDSWKHVTLCYLYVNMLGNLMSYPFNYSKG